MKRCISQTHPTGRDWCRRSRWRSDRIISIGPGKWRKYSVRGERMRHSISLFSRRDQWSRRIVGIHPIGICITLITNKNRHDIWRRFTRTDSLNNDDVDRKEEKIIATDRYLQCGSILSPFYFPGFPFFSILFMLLLQRSFDLDETNKSIDCIGERERVRYKPLRDWQNHDENEQISRWRSIVRFACRKSIEERSKPLSTVRWTSETNIRCIRHWERFTTLHLHPNLASSMCTSLFEFSSLFIHPLGNEYHAALDTDKLDLCAAY